MFMYIAYTYICGATGVMLYFSPWVYEGSFGGQNLYEPTAFVEKRSNPMNF
jgi:hypothetical protein